MSLKEIIKSEIDSIASDTRDYCNRKFNFNGEKFSVSYSKWYKELSIWSKDGVVSLFSDKVKNISDCTEITFEAINNWLSGYIRCSDCGELIRIEEIAGNYFAGMYCKHCWETKWKAIEARETYD